MFQTSEEQKNEIIEYQKSNNINICERCKNAEVALICEECSPFHNFCKKVRKKLFSTFFRFKRIFRRGR